MRKIDQIAVVAALVGLGGGFNFRIRGEGKDDRCIECRADIPPGKTDRKCIKCRSNPLDEVRQ